MGFVFQFRGFPVWQLLIFISIFQRFFIEYIGIYPNNHTFEFNANPDNTGITHLLPDLKQQLTKIP